LGVYKISGFSCDEPTKEAHCNKKNSELERDTPNYSIGNHNIELYPLNTTLFVFKDKLFLVAMKSVRWGAITQGKRKNPGY
jgi:hypothetical protein